MSEKGGEKSKNPESSVDFKIILTSIITVFLGFILALSMILAGVQIGRNYESGLYTSVDPDEDVVDIIGVQYETKTFSYNPGIEDGAGTESSYRELLKKLGGEKNFYYIKSSAEYEKVLSQIKMFSGVQQLDDFELSDTFFNSGSVILVTAEKPGLSYFGINSINRDENYNIFIDTSAIDANDTINVEGKAILIKIENIQPTLIEVTERKE